MMRLAGMTDMRSGDGLLTQHAREIRSWVRMAMAAALFALSAAIAPGQGVASQTQSSAESSMAVVSRRCPTIAAVIRADRSLPAQIGAEKWPLALARVARFIESPDPECREALRILGDTVPRVKSPLGPIVPDGDPAEWASALPPPEFVRPTLMAKDAGGGGSVEPWPGGAAAVVRRGRLYLMAGLEADYFQDFNRLLRVTIDCRDTPPWDVQLSLAWRDGAWTGTWRDLRQAKGPPKRLKDVAGAFGAVAELALDVSQFVPAGQTKPIWVLSFEKSHRSARGSRLTATRPLPVFNEDALPGVAAGPYVQTFLRLAADDPLESMARTAAAIAVMSATMYQCSDSEVREKIRADNSEFLALAREIDRWQAARGVPYRLGELPLEAQLAWASRFHVHLDFFNHSRRDSEALNDAENYYWATTGVASLRELRKLAEQEDLVDEQLAETAERIDKWVKRKQLYTLSASYFERRLKTTDDPKERQRFQERMATSQQRKNDADVVGQFHGKPVSEYRLSHSQSLLDQIRKRGRTIGTCSHHTLLCRDLFRAIGIPTLTFGVEPSRSDKIDHVWPAYFDPAGHVWRSYQAGRKDQEWWHFFVVRVPVFSYAATAPRIPKTKDYQGPRPAPLILSQELFGPQVQEHAQRGFEQATIRQWMLLPGPH